MIPDFKTFIEESLWSEIQDRSSGDAIRKEDDVNLLDLDEFYEYIKEHYKANVKYYAMGGGSGAAISVDITEDILLLYKPKRGHILLSWSRVVIPIPFLDELADRYKIENPNTMRRIITEKDGSCTNKTFVDVIEFFFKYKKYMMNESLWSEIQDRSSGDAIRKEDDVNLLDRDEFYDYLKNKYNKISHMISEDPSEIHINLGWSYFPKRDYIIDIHWVEKNKIKNLYLNFGQCELNTLCDKKFKTGSANNGISNKEVLDIIDFCLDYISSHKEIESPMNESIWSDIQDRSCGKTVRKEDDVNILDINGLYEHIYDLYKQVNSFPLPMAPFDSYMSEKKIQCFSIPIFKENYKIYRLDVIFANNKISSLSLMATDENVRDFKQVLMDNFKVTIKDNKALKIEEKDGTLTNQTCMKLISVIVTNAPEPYLKKREN